MRALWLGLALCGTTVALAQDAPGEPEAPEGTGLPTDHGDAPDFARPEAEGLPPAKDHTHLDMLGAGQLVQIREHREAIDVLEGESEGLQKRVEALEEELAGLRTEQSRQRLKLLSPDLTFDLEGYYRTRAYHFGRLFDVPEGQQRPARYLEHKIRLRPIANYKGLAKLMLEIDALDGVIWGDNAGLASTPLFAGNPSLTDNTGAERQSIALNRAWMEFTLPVGLLRVGRQPSHWGMGLLANGGDGFDDTFGENKEGATFDRVMFATKPIAIAQTIAGKKVDDIPLFAAIGVDRLVEDPLTEFYGYECTAGLQQGVDADYDPRCDADHDGMSDQNHGYTDDDRLAEHRGQDWIRQQRDDVMEMIYVLVYRGEDVNYFGGVGDLTAGTYVVNRKQVQTSSVVWIVDAYVKAQVHGFLFETEALTIQGNTRAITLPGAYDPSGSVEDPLAKTANIWGYVGRVGYVQPDYKVMFEHGYASGDDNVADADFTGRPLHSDHNVGLLLYEEVIARVTSELWTDVARGLWSNGGVYNSRYIFPTVHFMPLENWELLGGFVMAWPDKPDGRFIRCADTSEGCSVAVATQKPLGWELDWAVKHRWHEHLLFSLEMGYAKATDRLPLEAAGLNPEGGFFTAQSRIAYEF